VVSFKVRAASVFSATRPGARSLQRMAPTTTYSDASTTVVTRLSEERAARRAWLFERSRLLALLVGLPLVVGVSSYVVSSKLAHQRLAATRAAKVPVLRRAPLTAHAAAEPQIATIDIANLPVSVDSLPVEHRSAAPVPFAPSMPSAVALPTASTKPNKPEPDDGF